MKKNINFKSIALIALLVIFSVACEESSQDVEPIVSTDDYPTATFVVSETNINEEGGELITVDITFDKMIDRGVSFNLEQVGGTAVIHEDYEIHDAIVQPYSNSAQMVIEILEDATPEDVETLELQVVRPSLASAYLISPNSQLPLISINIENYVSNSLDVSCDWDKGIEIGGSTYGTCANVDFDIYVSPADGFDINDPWASFNGDWQAATGDCPETFTIDPANYPDGEYIMWSDLWSNGFAGYGTDTLVPITATFLRAGVFSQDIVQDDSQALHSDSPGDADDPSGIHNGFIARIKVENGKFTITDFSGEEVVSGKSVNSKDTATKRPALPTSKESVSGLR
ncbi:MAG: hypothetical protein ABFS12_13375 [Bacteroidota bacterium]